MKLNQRSKYSISVDCVIFGYANNELQVALIKRKNAPFKGKWALPGGFMVGNETIEETAVRELKEETGLDNIYLEQFHVFSEPNRDPRGRVITVAFFALISSDNLELIATEDAESAKWYPAYNLPSLAFDHDKIFEKALESLRVAATIKPLIFELLPKNFSLSMFQNLYEEIFGISVDKRNFRKKINTLNFIQETTKITKGEKHRPAKLYKFNKKRYLTNKQKVPFSVI